MRAPIIMVLFALSAPVYAAEQPVLGAPGSDATERPVTRPSPVNEFGAVKMRAEAGSADAQYRLAQMYNAGLGTAPNLPEYRQWLERAATRGHGYAQVELGMNLELGYGGFTSDPVAGLAWTLRAAKQGQPPAYTRAARAYATGTGTAANPAEAYFWQSVAVNGDTVRMAENEKVARREVADDRMKAYLTEILKEEAAVLATYRAGLMPAEEAAVRERAAAFVPKPEL